MSNSDDEIRQVEHEIARTIDYLYDLEARLQRIRSESSR